MKTKENTDSLRNDFGFESASGNATASQNGCKSRHVSHGYTSAVMEGDLVFKMIPPNNAWLRKGNRIDNTTILA